MPIPSLDTILQAERSGNLVQAAQWIQEVLSTTPTYSALCIAARVTYKQNNTSQALAYLTQAIRLQPSASARFQLLVELLDINALALAEPIAKESVISKPNDFALNNVYGVILKRKGLYQQALHYFTKAQKLNPKNTSPLINLGNTYLLISKPGKAAESFLKATKLQPKEAEAFRLLASAYQAMSEYEKALNALKSAVARAPTDSRIWIDIGGIYYQQKEYEKTLEELNKALLKLPDNITILRAKAKTLRKLGQFEPALAIYLKQLQINPSDIDTLVELGDFYYFAFDDRQKANEQYAAALVIDPSHVHAAVQYCHCLTNSRYGSEAEHIEKAYEIAKDLIARVPDPSMLAEDVQSILLRNVDYDRYQQLGDKKHLLQRFIDRMNVGELHNQLGRVLTLEDRYDLLAYHREWGKKIEKIITPLPRPAARTVPRSKIRVGFMSSDLRHHPVTYFVQPILELYDRTQFEIYCYSFYPKQPDYVQQQISKAVTKFTVIPNSSDRDIAQQIAQDDLDILFELGGTTHLNKLQVMAYRPAPVQVSWLGYPHSCGLECIDYILVDPYTQPELPNLLTEKPFLMPHTWVTLGSLGFNDIPIEQGIPEDRVGYITFGTANNPYKYTPATFAAWANILKQVEGSKFLFIRPEGAVRYFRENVTQLFAQHGVSAERIVFVPVRGKHMPEYNQIDIALDTFPHTGGTTTCESLWMGVPTVSLVGPALFERLSFSNLSNAGLGDLCAFDVEGYIEQAVTLARQKERRQTLRHGLRQQIREHPLGQAEPFVRQFEHTIKNVLGKL